MKDSASFPFNTIAHVYFTRQLDGVGNQSALTWIGLMRNPEEPLGVWEKENGLLSQGIFF